MESGDSYLGKLLCDIQVLELSLTVGVDGLPTPCRRIGKAFLWTVEEPVQGSASALDLATCHHEEKGPSKTYFKGSGPYLRTRGPGLHVREMGNASLPGGIYYGQL